MKMTVIPIVERVIGTIFRSLEKRLGKLGPKGKIKLIHAMVLLIVARILRRVLES